MGYQKEQVVQIINSVINKVSYPSNVNVQTLFGEMRDLIKIMEDTRKELSALGAEALSSTHVNKAHLEIEEIVQETAAASTKIMDACEDITSEILHIDGEIGGTIEGHVMRIYEACSFQDITGQRLTKVASSLRTIDGKLKDMLEAFGMKMNENAVLEETREGDAALLNGPQVSAQAISQDEIDRLLAEFD
jgi:chemotaxis protein CheZ